MFTAGPTVSVTGGSGLVIGQDATLSTGGRVNLSAGTLSVGTLPVEGRYHVRHRGKQRL